MHRIALFLTDEEFQSAARSALRGADLAVCRDWVDFERARREGGFKLVVLPDEMPDCDAGQAFARVRDSDPEACVAFAVARPDFDRAVALMKCGAFDLLALPEPELGARLAALFDRAVEHSYRQAIERERRAIDFENRQTMHWRNLYANKDTAQAERLIREIAAAAAAGESRAIVDFVGFLDSLDALALDKAEQAATAFAADARRLVDAELGAVAGRFGRPYRLAFPGPELYIPGYVCQDMAMLRRVVRELVVNAVKYSPAGSALRAGLEVDDKGNMPVLNLWIRNRPRTYRALDEAGDRITGIPLDYSERVFDLFFAIEPCALPEAGEEWTRGSGLYVARKVLKAQGAWLSTANGLDCADGAAEPYVEFNAALPLHAKREAALCNPRCSPCPFILMRHRRTAN